MKSIPFDVIVIGAGAAGFMCAIEAAKRSRRVLLIDHANKPGKKILMSGGGRCNFTNLEITPQNYISHNPHFCKSALKRYTQWDFIDLVQRHKIPYHEKKHGQLFCDDKAKDIVNMLLKEADVAGAKLNMDESIASIKQRASGGFEVSSNKALYQCDSLVIATGGLSIPSLGSSGFGYDIARQFGIPVWPTRASLVPFTLDSARLQQITPLSGISNDCEVYSGKQRFGENLLFTHRGLSGPAMLQISNYWQSGGELAINLIPGVNLLDEFKLQQREHPRRQVKEFFNHYMAKRVSIAFIPEHLAEKPLQELAQAEFLKIAQLLQNWRVVPNGTEGYRTAEVTIGGVNCDYVSSKTMEVESVKGLYFVGEVLDVTGWLGGYNFQWAWSSGWAAGQAC